MLSILKKPDNIGFDVRGDVKIFDFGLAREFPADNMMVNGTYQMSGKTGKWCYVFLFFGFQIKHLNENLCDGEGSLRYMAPEVALELPYNETVDVYSLAIMAWQIFAMATPFSGYSIAMHNDLVVQKGFRPKLEPKWGDALCNIISRSWSKNIDERPKMKEVTKLLRDEVNKHEDEIDDFGQIDASSRTTNSEV